MLVSFDEWTGERLLATPGTNSGSRALPFQNWRHFKEAFAPEIVRQAIASVPDGVTSCLDPFGGSGTTPLACQFLGIRPTAIEVNPYLADLIEAKLSSYSTDAIAKDIGIVFRSAETADVSDRLSRLPPTFVEPGVASRWIFDREAAERILKLSVAVDQLPNQGHAKLLRALLGGVLINLSNVIVNGKGRRYRQGWERKRTGSWEVDEAFTSVVAAAVAEIGRFGYRRERGYDLRRGSCLELMRDDDMFDLAVFSPPYPNSFDYTDVYNVELWMLGYLDGAAANLALRRRTLASHVQILRKFDAMPNGSPLLDGTLRMLVEVQDSLWSRHIPAMLGGYFAEMKALMSGLRKSIRSDGRVWMVVGDSRYAGIRVAVGEILGELAESLGYEVERVEILRHMRMSAQQGGHAELAETLVVLRR